MAWFTVQYRDKNGAKAEAEFEAADKSALFKILAEKKISAVNIRPGRLSKKSGKKSGSAASSPNLFRGVIAGVVVVSAVFAAWYFFLYQPSRPSDPVDNRSPREAPQGDSKRVKVSAGDLAGGMKNPVAGTQGKRGEYAAETPTQASEPVANEPDAEAQPVKEPPKPHPVFKNGTDQLIWLAVFASNGAHIPPLPQISAADTDKFIDTLNDPIAIDPEDPPRIQDMKRKINELRKEVAGMIAQNPGKELSDILNEHRDEFNGRLNLHSDAQREYNRFLEEGDAEGAEEYRLQANELLAEYGAEPIKAETDDEESDGDDPGAGQN